jgi:hypothetical protein
MEKDQGYINSITERSPSSLREQLELLVVEGVRDDLIVYDEAAGLAAVRKLGGPELVAIATFEEWWRSDNAAPSRNSGDATAWRKEYWSSLARYPSELAFRLLREYSDWLASEAPNKIAGPEWLAWHTAYRQASDDWHQARRRLEDIDFALRAGDPREAALRALGVELNEIGVTMAMASYGVAMDLALATTGRVSAAVSLRVADVLEQQVRKVTRIRATNVPLWFTALTIQIRAGAWLQPWGDLTPAQILLSVLAASVPNLPPRMAAPSKIDMDRANKFLSTCRINSLRPEFLPRSGKGGPAKTPWNAARGFAQCFGIKRLSGERDAKR